MPSILRRSRRRELILTKSFKNAIQEKVHPPQHSPELIYCSSSVIDRTNFPPSPSPSTVKFPDFARPSLTLSLYRSPISNLQHHPIHTLPPELLIRVFELGSFDDALFLITISHVCHPWRMLAIHTHTLWRRLSFDSHGLRLWKERIARARGCSLDITITPPQHRFPDIDALALQLHLIVPHISRARSFELRFSSYSPFLWNTTLGPICHPEQRGNDSMGAHTFAPFVHALRLEKLTLCFPENDDSKEFGLFAGVAPRLDHVTLDGIRLTWLPGLYGRLTHLDYTHHGFTTGSIAVDEVLGMIRISCALRELRICFRRTVLDGEVLYLSHDGVPAGQIHLLQLERLVLAVDKSDIDIPPELTLLLSRLSVPNLHELHLVDLRCQPANRRWWKSAPFPGLRAALSLFEVTIPSSIKVLAMAGRWADHSSILSLAKCFRELRNLEVDGVEKDLVHMYCLSGDLPLHDGAWI
ncbi:uncharacterized protein F5891DRAFT_469592 [Suillus fuscotomentosus]|uniref:F-box domain-containing protein n=1 Tax=Suillus fuscotomentosus TaxID=1912939 RepID=A0AAD4EI40_9AGAM|nr:uncharacterized protein F5891DRAFT_469592 [Suillus fuscotomentosus]KAG1906496.1 hypothetical protein F5891DRAFT_469592 [Suillus fuscotomentosus]